MNYLDNIIKFSKNIGIQEFYILPAFKILDQKQTINIIKAKDLFKKVALNISKQYFKTERIKFNIDSKLINSLSNYYYDQYINYK